MTQLRDLLLELGQRPRDVGPVEADPRDLGRHLERLHHRGQRAPDAVEHRGRLVGLALRRTFRRLDGLPVAQDLLGGVGLVIAEDVRVTAMAATARRITARFIRLGPAPRIPRRPAVPKISPPANRSASSAVSRRATRAPSSADVSGSGSARRQAEARSSSSALSASASPSNIGRILPNVPGSTARSAALACPSRSGLAATTRPQAGCYSGFRPNRPAKLPVTLSPGWVPAAVKVIAPSPMKPSSLYWPVCSECSTTTPKVSNP